VSTIAVDEPTFTIAEVADKTGVSAHALRYYERIGLLDVGRQASGHRRFSEADVDRVVFICRLRATAMPIREIQRYFALVAEGSSTEGDRLALLHEGRVQFTGTPAEAQATKDLLVRQFIEGRSEGPVAAV